MRLLFRLIGGVVVGMAVVCSAGAEPPRPVPAEPSRARPAAPRTLPVPAAVADDAQAVELARVWVVRERLQVALRADAIDHPVQWGAVLAEMARHIANASVQGRGADRTEVLDGIVLGFQASLNHTPAGLEGRVAP